jgi:hypothetical protein
MPEIQPDFHKQNPISPVLDSLPYHRAAKEKRSKAGLIGFFVGTIITAAIGILLWYLQISTNIILPLLALVWIGSIIFIYSVSSRN